MRSEGAAKGLVAALDRAAALPPGNPSVVVLAEMPSRGSRPSEVTGNDPRPDGAGAFWVGEGGGTLPLSLALAGDAPTGLAAAALIHRAHSGRSPGPRWVGDWGPLQGTTAGTSVSVARTLEGSLAAVSEGAYVPRPRYVENLPSRWRFMAEECPACGTTTFPARGRCRRCGGSEGLLSRRLPRDDALVIAATVIGPGGQPTEFDPQVASLGPYEVVLAELARGQRVTLQVADAAPGSIRIGDRVDTLLRRLYPQEGEWRYGRKAVPRRSPAPGRT